MRGRDVGCRPDAPVTRRMVAPTRRPPGVRKFTQPPELAREFRDPGTMPVSPAASWRAAGRGGRVPRYAGARRTAKAAASTVKSHVVVARHVRQRADRPFAASLDPPDA